MSTVGDGSIDGIRLLSRLSELAAITATPGQGVTRLAYSPEDVVARRLVASWMEAAGLIVEVDAATNVIGRSTRAVRSGTAPGSAIVIGSHIDTVVHAGALDGCYGVLAGIEVADALRHSGEQRHPLVVVAFANEEGAGGSAGFDGSRAVVGRPNPLDGRDRAGRSLAERLEQGGGSPTELANAAWPAGSVAAYLELHIEQGPVLDAEGHSIGLVTGITGRRNLDVTIAGAANHAGTTPMSLRADALAAAARVVLAVEAVALEGLVRVATTGSVEVTPNVRNVVPGLARLGVDLRDLDEDRMAAATAALREHCAGIATATGTTITVEEAGDEVPAPTDERFLAAFEAAAAERGLSARRLVSGAGHDAQVLAALAPIGMLFVPSRAGVSHSPAEHTDDVHLLSGAEVLLDVVRRIDRALDPDPTSPRPHR